jgi:hypothetical protein
MDFLGQCVKESCGLLESSGGSGTTLTANNKLLGVGDKQVGTTDATDLQFLTDNKIRAVLDSSGNFDVRDLRSSEIDLLPNQQFSVVSGTATLSNFESTITTTSESDEFKIMSEFIPDTAPINTFSEDVYIKFDGSTTNLDLGVIDSLSNITLSNTSAVTIAPNDILRVFLFKTSSQIIISYTLNGIGPGGILLTTNLDLEHQFYFTGYNGTCSITRSKRNDTEQKGSINLVDNHNFGLRIGEETKDYLNIDTLNDAMTLSNVTDINTGSIIFNDNEIVIKKELVGSQESMVPNNTIVQQSNFSSLNGEILTITADETNITIPITPIFTLGDKFELTLNIDKQSPTTGYYIGVGEYSVVPLTYTNIPQSVYPTNVYYSTPTGFGGSFTPPGIWSVDPNFSAPNYNTVGLYEIKLVLEESGEFNLYVDGTIKFNMTLVGSNTLECFIWTPTQGTAEFDTSYASMLSGDGGIVIDGYPVAQTFNQLLGGDPNTGVMTFKQVNTQGLIIGDEENIPDPTTDNSLRFGAGAGIVNAETLTLETEFKTSFVSSGLGAEVVKIDHGNANLDLLGYHLQTDRIDVGSYTGPADSIDDPLLWSTSNNSNMILTTNTFNQQSTSQTAWAYTDTFQPFGLKTDINILFSTIAAGSRHYVSIVSDEIINSISLAYQDSVTLQVSQFGVQKTLVTRQAGAQTDSVLLGNGNYPSGTLVTFQIRDNIVKTLLNGVEIVSGVEFPITNNVYRISIKDTNTQSGDVVGTTNISTFSLDFTDKTDNINIYSGTDIQFENDMKISRDAQNGDDWLGFDVTNDEIDIFKDIQSTGGISCVSLTTNRIDIGLGSKYITSADELGVLSGADRILEDGVSYVICGSITVDKNIRYGVANSIRGLDFQSSITFDETAQDCQFVSNNQDFYLSTITINQGGGRFTAGGSVGLIQATNYNITAPAPFYGREKRFRLADCNIVRPYKVGQITGYGTLNINNNFIDGGGGLAGELAPYYTVDGISVSDGLSLEFNNNKLVLFQGAQITSTGVQLRMLTDADNSLGFNAVTITGNIFHPRDSENGIKFEVGSSTALGNISGNTFIRTGGTAPLIDYPDQSIFDNYNPVEIVNYTINANAGFTNSEPNLKTIMTGSTSTTSVTYVIIEPLDNSDILAISESSRFAIQLDLTGVVGSISFKPNERILDVASSSTALIVSVDPLVGTDQTIYITDMTNAFSATPTTFTGSVTGSATGGSLRGIYYYFEKDPRRLTIHATLEVTTGNNETYFLTHGSETVADDDQESYALADNAGAGSSLSIIGSKTFNMGSKLAFWVSSLGASATTVDKMVVSTR